MTDGGDAGAVVLVVEDVLELVVEDEAEAGLAEKDAASDIPTTPPATKGRRIQERRGETGVRIMGAEWPE
ncbi:MAG TPA: hypothetical protein VNF50_06535 [Acidimicrobiales bacterium]|nr:hypothetical protein [Acidimicrobiales bacterium]